MPNPRAGFKRDSNVKIVQRQLFAMLLLGFRHNYLLRVNRDRILSIRNLLL